MQISVGTFIAIACQGEVGEGTPTNTVAPSATPNPPVIGTAMTYTAGTWSSGTPTFTRWESSATGVGSWSTAAATMPNANSAPTDTEFGLYLRPVETNDGVEAAGAAVGQVNYANAFIMLEASDITGLSNGAAVASWAGKSAVGATAVQATGSKQPAYTTGVVNGLPVVRFGADDSMGTSAIDLTDTPSVTLYIVASAPSGSDRTVVEIGAAPLTAGVAVVRDSANKITAFVKGDVGLSTFVSNQTITTTHKLITGTFDKSLATNETNLWINGDVAGARGTNSNNTGNLASAAVFLAARNNGSLFLSGDIALVFGYKGVHNSTQRAAVEAHINGKYALY
jgi:hypothetical protein